MTEYSKETIRLYRALLKKVPKSQYHTMKMALQWYSNGEQSQYKKTGNGMSAVRKTRQLTRDEMWALLEWVKTRSPNSSKEIGLENYCMMALLACTDVHTGAIVLLRWEDRTVNGGKVGFYFTDRRVKKHRLIPSWLDDELAHMWNVMHGDKPKSGSVFYTVPSRPGDIPRPLSYHTIWRRVKDAMKKAQAIGRIDSHYKCVATELRLSLYNEYIDANKKEVKRYA